MELILDYSPYTGYNPDIKTFSFYKGGNHEKSNCDSFIIRNFCIPVVQLRQIGGFLCGFFCRLNQNYFPHSGTDRSTHARTHSNIKGYRAAYATCENIADMPFHNLRLNDLQQVIDHCGKNYPTLKKIRVLFNQLYSYAMKHEIVSKDYSAYVNISKYKDRNPNKNIRSCFSTSEIALLWKHKNDPYCQTVLMLIYNGVRVSELLDLKKENVHLSEQYFDVIDSKTENGIRKVPIADKVLPFYQRWLHDCSDCEYLIHTLDSQHFTYYMYYHNVFQPLMFRLHIDHTPHCCRHTTISLLAEAHVDQTTIKKIVGHSGAMSLTERIYTHLDVPALVEAINQI